MTTQDSMKTQDLTRTKDPEYPGPYEDQGVSKDPGYYEDQGPCEDSKFFADPGTYKPHRFFFIRVA